MRAIKILLVFIMGNILLMKNVMSDNITNIGKEYADSLNSKYGGIGADTDPNTVPGYKGTDVPESKYYESRANFENLAKDDAQNNETNIYVRDASTKRPPVKIDPTKDPLFKRYDEITEKSHSLSETYQGCKKLPVGTAEVTKYDKKSCFEYGRRDQITFYCDRKLEINCRNNNAGTYVPFGADAFNVSGPAWAKRDRGTNIHFGADTNDRRGNCTQFTNTITFSLRSLEEVIEFRIENFVFDDWITISLNGNTVYSEPFTRCERGQVFSKPGFDLKPYLRPGNNVITVVNTVSGGGRAWINLKAIKKIICDQRENFVYSCEGQRNHRNATLASSSCIEGAGTRNISGTSVVRDCWRWRERFTELALPVYTKDPLCTELVQKGCGFISNNCVDEDPGGDPSYCKKRELSYSCPYLEAARFVEICGDQLVCPDGECTKEYQKYDPSTEDLKKAVTAMEVAKILSTELNRDKLSVFKGANKECKQHMLGFKNCCKDSGWGMSIGISDCSSDEKELGMAREAGRAHYIGSYKTGNVLNRRTYQAYCIYPSKLARIIIEQGKSQLSKGFGEVKSPDCSGFTLTELETLDFDKINFSEFYNDAMSKVSNDNTPGVDQSVAKFKTTIEHKLKELKEIRKENR
ncbi:MAG: conjugal transfer protein TraN [Oligoflexia bacterium]|nr:conjugal transfer protein TraN [Oligoflexia bacterium]